MIHNDAGGFCRWCGIKIYPFSTHFCTYNKPLTSPSSIDEAASKTLQKITDGAIKVSYKKEAVNHPDHYEGSDGSEIECIDAIQAALTPEEFKGFCKGSVFKYLWREGKKDETKQEIGKGIWYMNRILEDAKKKKA